jgi:hypothetical protein
MNFEEKMDAMRMNLELATHDIESLRASIEGLRAASASQYENIQVLMKVSENLLATAQSREQRISGLEGRA